jgi:hypothetical protein
MADEPKEFADEILMDKFDRFRTYTTDEGEKHTVISSYRTPIEYNTEVIDNLKACIEMKLMLIKTGMEDERSFNALERFALQIIFDEQTY